MNRKKVVLLHPIINPMRINLFNKINLYFNKKNIEFNVIFLSLSDKNRHWKNNKKNINFNYTISKNLALRVGRKDLFTFFINQDILKQLNQKNPDVIIACEWANSSTYLAKYWAKKNNKKFILWAGSTASEKSWRRTLFLPIVKKLIKSTEQFICYGTRAKEYLISLGANPKNVHILYNSVNLDFFTEKKKSMTEEKRNKIKNNIGITTNKIILFNGQLITRKGIFDLLQGYREYQKKDNDISLLCVGTGKEKKQLKKIIDQQKIKNIFFTGFVEYEDLYKYYCISDLLILPSHEEVWGLVINEAMACGLPVITTGCTGASIDLIDEGKNGYIIKPKCPNCIFQAIDKIFQNNLNKTNNSLTIVQKTKVENNLRILDQLL